MSKKYSYVRVNLIVFAIITLLAGCSGGGGDEGTTPTDPNTVFELFPSTFFTAGTTDTLNFTGTDTAGGVYTATISQQTQAQSTFLDQPAIPILLQLQLTNTANGGFVSNVGTGYYSVSAADRHYLGYSDASSTTVSAITTAIPQTAKIGDFGVIGTYTDNAGEVDIESWRLDDGGNGRAKLVNLSTSKDQSDNLILSSTTTSLIDTNGNVISITLVLFFANEGVTITLNGS